MLKKHLAAYAAATALMTAAAVAQTSPAAPGSTQPATSAPATTTQPPATTAQPPATTTTRQPTMTQSQNQGSTMSGAAAQVMTEMSPQQMRGSKLMGVDVYGSDNQQIGDIDELILSQDGRIEAIIVGVGGFLGIGEKDVAIPFDQVEFMSEEQVEAANASNRTAATNTAGGVTTPGTPAGGQPATTGSTNQAGTTAAASDDDDDAPERAMVKMTRADLQNAPQFRYNSEKADRAGGTGAAGNTNPPTSATRPGTQAPQ